MQIIPSLPHLSASSYHGSLCLSKTNNTKPMVLSEIDGFTVKGVPEAAEQAAADLLWNLPARTGSCQIGSDPVEVARCCHDGGAALRGRVALSRHTACVCSSGWSVNVLKVQTLHLYHV